MSAAPKKKTPRYAVNLTRDVAEMVRAEAKVDSPEPLSFSRMVRLLCREALAARHQRRAQASRSPSHNA